MIGEQRKADAKPVLLFQRDYLNLICTHPREHAIALETRADFSRMQELHRCLAALSHSAIKLCRCQAEVKWRVEAFKRVACRWGDPNRKRTPMAMVYSHPVPSSLSTTESKRRLVPSEGNGIAAAARSSYRQQVAVTRPTRLDVVNNRASQLLLVSSCNALASISYGCGRMQMVIRRHAVRR